MAMTSAQMLVTIAVVALGTAATRFLPFLLFPDSEKTPKIIAYLGRVLPYAAMGMLVVYCLKDISFISGSRGIPELAAVMCVVLLHLWRSNTLLSIGAGTAVYMLLVNFVFI